MTLLLPDTYVLIAILNDRPPQVRTRFSQESEKGSTIYLSTVVEFELRYGIAKSQYRQKNLAKLEALLRFPFVPLPFGSAADSSNALQLS